MLIVAALLFVHCTVFTAVMWGTAVAAGVPVELVQFGLGPSLAKFRIRGTGVSLCPLLLSASVRVNDVAIEALPLPRRLAPSAISLAAQAATAILACGSVGCAVGAGAFAWAAILSPEDGGAALRAFVRSAGDDVLRALGAIFAGSVALSVLPIPGTVAHALVAQMLARRGGAARTSPTVLRPDPWNLLRDGDSPKTSAGEPARRGAGSAWSFVSMVLLIAFFCDVAWIVWHACLG